MANKPTPTPASAPKGPSLIEYTVITVLAAVIVAVILYLVGPTALAVLGSIIAGF